MHFMLSFSAIPQENLKHYIISSYLWGSSCLREASTLGNNATIKGKIGVLHLEQDEEIVKIQTFQGESL